MLGEDGRVIEQGSFEYLRSSDGFVSSLILHPELLGRHHPESGSGESSSNTRSDKPSAAPKVLRGPTANDAADLTRQIGDLSVYKYYLASIGWKIGLASGAASFMYMLGSRFPRE